MIRILNGGPDQDRTDYLITASDALSQMSYGPQLIFQMMVLLYLVFFKKTMGNI